MARIVLACGYHTAVHGWVAFVIVASGIIVFVPLYKKYRKNKK